MDGEVVTCSFERLNKVEDRNGIGGVEQVPFHFDSKLPFSSFDFTFVVGAHSAVTVTESVVAEVKVFSVSCRSWFEYVIIGERYWFV